MDRVDYQSLIVQDLLNDHKDHKLNLNPWYQRRSVWTDSQKAYLINTLFQRKPIPALYIRHTIDLEKQKSVKEVVDGQQRSKAIIDYCNGAFSAKTASGSRKKYEALTSDEREKLLLTPLPIGYLLGATDSDVIDIFARINSVSKTLNSQEKRNAQFGGEFKQFCLDLSIKCLPFWRATGIFSANDISRMNEVLFVSDLVLNMLKGLSDFRPLDLDRIYRENENLFPRENEIRLKWDRVFDALYSLPVSAIKETIFVRQPIFFSMFLSLDAKTGSIGEGLESKLFEIDALVRDESKNEPEVIAFRTAITSSTQRLASRKVRRDFLSPRL